MDRPWEGQRRYACDIASLFPNLGGDVYGVRVWRSCHVGVHVPSFSMCPVWGWNGVHCPHTNVSIAPPSFESQMEATIQRLEEQNQALIKELSSSQIEEVVPVAWSCMLLLHRLKERTFLCDSCATQRLESLIQQAKPLTLTESRATARIQELEAQLQHAEKRLQKMKRKGRGRSSSLQQKQTQQRQQQQQQAVDGGVLPPGDVSEADAATMEIDVLLGVCTLCVLLWSGSHRVLRPVFGSTTEDTCHRAEPPSSGE